MSNPFFKNNGPFIAFDILKIINVELGKINHNHEIFDIKDLSSSEKNDITFFIRKNIRYSKKHQSIFLHHYRNFKK